MLGAAVAAEAAALPGQEARAPATAQAAGPVAEPNEGGGHRGAEEDTLEAMLEEVGGRKRGRQEMFARMDAEADARMDNGVRINPMLKEMARRAAVAEEVAGDREPTCEAGHAMAWCSEGSAGLWCDGGCGRRIQRGAGWWGCATCDFDVCKECSGAWTV